MAYRAFEEWPFAVPGEQAIAAVAERNDTPDFAPIERSVIALAAHDKAWSVRPRTLTVRLVEALFGFHPANRLADPRLEALRRFAVLARTARGALPAAEIDAFIAAGFSRRAALTLSPQSS